MFTVGGAQFTVGEAVFTVGLPKWYWGRFFGGHSYFLSVSNDFSEKTGPKIGQSL